MMRALALALSLPCLYWPLGTETAPDLKGTGVEQICVPPSQAEGWRSLDVRVTPLPDEALAALEPLATPGIVPRPGVASPTRSPWVDSNGWRFLRNPTGRFVHDLPAGRGALGAAEAHAYGADVVLKIARDDLQSVGAMLRFLAGVPPSDLRPVADFGFVDDGSPEAGEAMNLFVRRNLLFERVAAPDPRFPFTVTLGSKEFPREEAADPSAFALTVRRKLGDDQRSLRIYGSEVVIARLTAQGGRARVYLLNYGRRPIEGLRVRVRGTHPKGHAYEAATDGQVDLVEQIVTDGATEFTLPSLTTYAVVDLQN